MLTFTINLVSYYYLDVYYMPAYLLQSCTSETYPPNANSVSLQWENKKKKTGQRRLKKTIKTRNRTISSLIPQTKHFTQTVRK